MKYNNQLNRTLTAIAAAFILLGTATSQAVTYYVSINTSPLLSLPASGPFSLDFQFNNGSVLNNNTATISNFNFFGGFATGSAVPSDLGVIGNIGSTVSFNNSAAFQELYQTFIPGSALTFNVDLTNAVDGLTPDLFAVAILDSNLLNIPTTGFGDSLVAITINSTIPEVQVGQGTGDFAGVTASVPDSGATIALLGFALAGMGGLRRKLMTA